MSGQWLSDVAFPHGPGPVQQAFILRVTEAKQSRQGNVGSGPNTLDTPPDRHRLKYFVRRPFRQNDEDARIQIVRGGEEGIDVN